MTIGLICAIPQELAHLRDALDAHACVVAAGLRFDHGRLDGHEVILVGAGIGKVNTAMTASLLCDRFGCRLVVFSGVAGGLDPALRIGDVVIADLAIQHDAGVIENGVVNTYQAGHVPFFNPTDRLGYPVDPGLLARVKAGLQGFELGRVSASGISRSARIVYGTILSGDQYLHCETTRERLFRELGGRAIEMEGGALGQVCEAFGVPWLDIRALSDLAGKDSRFDFERFVHEVAASSAAILRQLLKTV